jgi:hypothetical protein
LAYYVTDGIEPPFVGKVKEKLTRDRRRPRFGKTAALDVALRFSIRKRLLLCRALGSTQIFGKG